MLPRAQRELHFGKQSREIPAVVSAFKCLVPSDPEEMHVSASATKALPPETPEHPYSSHRTVGVARACGDKSIHAQTKITLAFREHTVSKAAMPKRDSCAGRAKPITQWAKHLSDCPTCCPALSNNVGFRTCRRTTQGAQSFANFLHLFP